MGTAVAPKVYKYCKARLPKLHRRFVKIIRLSPERWLGKESDPAKPPSNQPLRIDKYADNAIAANLQVAFPGKVVVSGEESLSLDPSLEDLTGRHEIFTLVDLIDGTDLLQRGMGNWCSAMVLFVASPEPSIIGALVCDHEGTLFCAEHSSKQAHSRRLGRKADVALSRESSPETIENACIRAVAGQPSGPLNGASLSADSVSISFYGQKIDHFLTGLSAGLTSAIREASGPSFRIYNLGGIPMMLRVANGTVGAVFHRIGAKPHDFVPGAYIALKAGAYLGDMDGNRITEHDLAKMLLTPKKSGPPYILAGTETLYTQLRLAFANDAKREVTTD